MPSVKREFGAVSDKRKKKAISPFQKRKKIWLREIIYSRILSDSV